MTSGGADVERLIFAGTSDLAGLVRGKAFAAADLEERAVTGVGYTASNIMMSPFGPIYATPFGTAGDLKLVPDMSTRTMIPAPGGAAELALGDIRELDDRPWTCCPRSFLRRGLAALESEFGLRILAAFEHEFVYTGVADRPGSSYAFDLFRRSGTLGGRAFTALRAAEILPDSFLPEYGPRQFEITVKPSAGLRAADDAVLVREIVRACAAEDGARAIFAPILEPAGIGNGTHVHFSLHDTHDRPVMHDRAAAFAVAPAAAPFLAGVLDHLPALTALTAPSVASFLRLRPNKWAPTWANIAVRDRGAALRVCPVFNAGSDSAPQFNVEYRVADAAASPYVALGAIVHAGLDGLRRRLALPPHPAGDVDALAAAGVRRLPDRLETALELLANTAAARDWLGDTLLDAYLLFKRSEIEAVSGLSDADVCARYAEVY